MTASNGTPILMMQKGGKLNISGGSNDVSIVSEDYKHYNAIEAHAGVVNIDGKANIKGDILAVYDRILNDKGIVYLNLIDGSKLLSTIDNKVPSDPQAKGDINLNLSGRQSQWKMTGNSAVDSLTLSDDAKVSFGYDYDTPDTASHLDNNNKAMTLTTNSLAGNGVFEMRTAIGTN
ncbi:Pertactin, partial [Snodgrassella alvi SCGC AB-598-O02]